MTASILSIVAVGAAVLWWWLQRKTSPLAEHRERYEQSDLDLARRNSTAATIHATADLDELERLERVRDQSPGHS